MSETVGIVITIVVLVGIGWLYVTAKEKAKRGLFFRGQYEREKAVTLQNLILETTAPIQTVQSSLAQHIPDDRSTRAAFFGDAMRVHMENPNRIIFNRIGKLSTVGNGDDFTASITFEPLAHGILRAEVSIDRWKQNYGVARRAGIHAMEKFMSDVVTAFRTVDPAVRVNSS